MDTAIGILATVLVLAVFAGLATLFGEDSRETFDDRRPTRMGIG